jgi:hypothetical protein
MDGQKKIIMLGTGASYASEFTLPTMKGFFDESVQDKQPLSNYLKWLYPGKTKEDYNLEEVLAHLDISRTRDIAWGTVPREKRYDSKIIYDDLIDYVNKRLCKANTGICKHHKEIADNLNAEDTVITLNYDLIMDNALLAVTSKSGFSRNIDDNEPKDPRMGKLPILLGSHQFFQGHPPSLLSSEKATGFYLKLHGSLDWLICPNQECPNAHRIYPVNVLHPDDNDGQQPGKPCRTCGTSIEMLIVPPVATKRIKVAGILAFLWNLALSELRDAKRIVIAGLSFAPSDFELRWLVREAMRYRSSMPTIEIVNPSAKTRNDIKELMPAGCVTMTQYNDLRSWLDGKPCS